MEHIAWWITGCAVPGRGVADAGGRHRTEIPVTRDRLDPIPDATHDPEPDPSGHPGDRSGRPGGGSREVWPASPLAALGRSFDLLVQPPAPYAIDGVAFPGLPPGPVEAVGLRGLLLSRQTPPSVRDEVWRELVDRARRPAPEGQVWTVIAAGVALPGLTAAAGALCRGWRGETADIDAEVLAGFVARLKTLDTSGPRVAGRLIDAGVRAGRRARAQAGDRDVVRVEGAWSAPPGHPWDHPDWVLARAVRAGVLDRVEARLIGATRLETLTLVEAAGALGLDPVLAADWRKRAEARLAEAVRAGEVDTARTELRRPAGERRQAARLALVKADRARRRAARRGDQNEPVVASEGAVGQQHGRRVRHGGVQGALGG